MTNMHFPSKYFIVKRIGSEKPLAYLTPDGTDAAAKKRKESALKWAYMTPEQRHSILNGEPNPAVVVIDNVLKDGFKIAHNVRRTGYFGSGNVVWRIEHPDGFEFEISSENLESIIAETDIIEGVIQSKCLIARNGARNALIPESCDDYQKTIIATSAAKEKTYTIKQAGIKPGDTVRLKTNLPFGDQILTYIGEFFPVAIHTSNKTGKLGLQDGDITSNRFVNHAARHLFATNNSPRNSILIISEPKIIHFISELGLDPIEVKHRINACLQKRVGFVTDVPVSVDLTFHGDWIPSAKSNALKEQNVSVSVVGIIPTGQTREWETKIVPRLISGGSSIKVAQWQTDVNVDDGDRQNFERHVNRLYPNNLKNQVISKVGISSSHLTYYIETDLARNDAKIFYRKKGSDWFQINRLVKVRVNSQMVDNHYMFPDDFKKSPNQLPILRMMRVEPYSVGVDELQTGVQDLLSYFYDTEKTDKSLPRALAFGGDKLTFTTDGYEDRGGIFSTHSKYRTWVPTDGHNCSYFARVSWPHNSLLINAQPDIALSDVKLSYSEISSISSPSQWSKLQDVFKAAIKECAENTFDLIENFAQYEFAQFALSIEPKE